MGSISEKYQSELANLHVPARGGKSFKEQSLLSVQYGLQDLLRYEDRNSMAFSIESRVPFLDPRLVDYVFSIADSVKFELGETKKILRQSLKGILPQETLNRSDKKGFVTPGEIKWLRGPLNYLVNEFKYDSLDFLNISKTKKVVDEFIKGDDSNANLIWRLAVLNHWIKKN